MIGRLATAVAVALGGMALDAHAQAYPNKPIKLVVGFAPGGAADTVARAYGDCLSRSLGQPIVIDNKPGAGSSIAADNVAKSAPDGYTVLIASPSSISVNPAINPKLPYKPGDLQPVTKVSTSPLIIVANPAAGIGSVKDLIAAAKKDPDKLNYATSGVGSAPHFGGAYFSQVAGVKMVHVPFKGGSPAIVSVVSGDTQISFATPPSVLPMVKAGRLRALAVTDKQRSSLMPDIPGMTEAGLPDFAIAFWYGFFTPAGTSRDITKKLFDATSGCGQREEVKSILAREGTEVALSKSTEEFAAFLVEDEKFWAKLAKDSGAKAD